MGSLHCAGMCGAFVAFAVAVDAPMRARERSRLQAAYHGGRLIVYVGLGALAGALGGAFDLAGQAAGIQRPAVIFAGVSLMVFGSVALLRLSGARIGRAPVPGALQRAAASALRFAIERPPLVRAALTGLFTTLLPCGWLYAFVITAAGSADPLLGALIMACFWAGTLPILVALGSGAQSLLARAGSLGARVPAITALLVIAAGLWAILDRGRLDPTRLTIASDAARSTLVEHVRSIAASEPPCCHDNADPR